MSSEVNSKENARWIITAVVIVAGLAGPLRVSAQNIRQIPLPSSQNPSNADIPFSGAVWAGNTLYVSGWLDPDRKVHTDTKSQTVGILKDLQKFLKSQNLTLGGVVMMREYIGQDSRAGILGARAGYAEFFGTKDNPRKPASTAIVTVLPAAGSGALMEIDLVVVRPE